MSQQQSARYQRSAGGMVGALVVLVGLIGVWLALHALTGNDPPSPVQTVDYTRDVPTARKAAGFDLVAPPRLPSGWRATTVSFTPGLRSHWHLGVLTDQGRYVGLEQSTESVTSMVRAYVDESAARGTPLDVSGQSWSTYTDARGDLALARREGRTTTVVIGHRVPRSDLVSYTASLR